MFAVICIPDFALQAVLRHESFISTRLQLGDPRAITAQNRFNGFDGEETVETVSLPTANANTRLKPGANKRASLPVALLDSVLANSSKAVVLECTETAKAAGVCAGLSAPQAMARCPDLVLKTRSAPAEQGATDILLQTAYAFSPHIENTAPGVCTIDLRGLNFHYSDRGNEARFKRGTRSAGCGVENQRSLTSAAAEENIGDELQWSFGFCKDATKWSPSPWGEGKQALLVEWAGKIIAALRQLDFIAQFGIAATPNLAFLAARTARPLLVIEHTGDFFASLSIEALEPAPELLGILKRWGIHTAGEFFALGKDAIAERLGAAALELFERASTQTIRPLNIAVPADTFEEQMDFDVEIETIEPLLFVLRRFIEQLTTRISLNYRVVAELQLGLMLSSGASHERLFKIPAPTANVETLFRMLHTHLENLHTEAPIVSLRLGARPARAGHQQFGLFESALHDPNNFHETLARLAALLGAERVGTPIVEATHRPDSFRMEMAQFDEARTSGLPESLRAATGGRDVRAPGLCLRRFRPPFHADVELRDGRPAFVSTLKFTSPVVRSRGPWCASGHWWDSRRWLRQEWDVEMRDGAVFRLFNGNGDWLLEGIYD